ncbi:MAG: PAS domain S-box protein [Bacteroidales bacterium]
MKTLFHRLNNINQIPEFREYREKNLRSMLAISTIIGVVFVLGFYSLDQIKNYPNLSDILWFRIISSGVFLLNLGIALLQKKHQYLKFHVYLGFYLCSVYSSVQSVITGGIFSPYWIGISLIMMVWFIFVPFSFQALIINGILFVTQYFFIVLFFETEYFSWGNIVELAFYLKGFLIIGAIISVVNNNQAAIIFEKHHKLEESEQKYKNLVEHANDGIVILQDGYVKFINEMMANILGWTPEEMLNTPFINYLAEEERPRILDHYRQRQQGKSLPTIYESVLVDKWGQKKPVEFNSSIINFRGEIATQTYIRDISERKASQHAIQEGELRFRLFMNNLPAYAFIKDDQGKYIYANKSLKEFLGMDNVEGKTMYDLFPPALADTFAQKEKESLAGGDINETEDVVPDKNGQEKIIQTIRFKMDPTSDSGLIGGLAVDITERKRLEAELEKSHALLRKDYSITLEQVQTYSVELKNKQNELLKLQKDNLQSQFEALKNQVNPHFLFNSLNVLISLISVEPELAEKFTGQLSKIYRYALEHRSEDLVSLSTELDFLHSYMFLLNIRFTGKLKFNINITEEKHERKLLPLAMQLLIENAIKHNTFSVKSPLNIEIFIDEDDYLHVENNYQKREKHIITTGIGLQNITDRYSFFSDKELFFGIVEDRFVAKIPLL